MSRLLTYGLGGIAAVMVLLMMIITSIDVAGRYLFNNPLTGAFEITELSLAVLIFLGLPLATDSDEHIRVDLLDAFMPAALKNALTLLVDWASAGMLLIIGWQLVYKTQSIAEDGQVSHSLEIPLAPVGALMAGSCLLSAVVLVVKGIKAVRAP